MVGLGQAEAADDFALASFGRYLLALRLAAVGVDRMHHQRGLHRHQRAIAGIDALDLARDQPGSDIVEAGAAVFFRDGRAEQAEFAHLADDRRVVFFVAIGREHARQQLLLGVVARGVAHHALVLGQFAFEVERIVPFEVGVLEQGRLGVALFRRLAGFLGHLRHGVSCLLCVRALPELFQS